jgi:hypothetical protein
MAESTKDPENESKNPAPMPETQQGQGGPPKPQDPEGQQGGYHPKMAIPPESPPGIELDGKAQVIPIDQRTEGNRQKALDPKK